MIGQYQFGKGVGRVTVAQRCVQARCLGATHMRGVAITVGVRWGSRWWIARWHDAVWRRGGWIARCDSWSPSSHFGRGGRKRGCWWDNWVCCARPPHVVLLYLRLTEEEPSGMSVRQWSDNNMHSNCGL